MDYLIIEQTLKSAEQLLYELTLTIDDRKSEIERIRIIAEKFYQMKYKSVLTNLDIETLAVEKNGIRVAYLKDAGIDNMYQLSLMNYSQIRAVEGIGTQNAKKINKLKNQIIENVKNNISLRINIDNPSDYDYALVKAICIFLCHDELRKQLKAEWKPLQNEFDVASEKAKNVGSRLLWMFALRSEKTEVENAILKLKKYIEENNNSINELLERYYDIEKASNRVYMTHFNKYSSFYYAILEKYCKKLTSANKIKTTISEEFVKEINAHSVHLSKFKATLRPYQLFGVKYILHQKRTLLGDEMGLGKTIQAIAAMVSLKATKKNRFLVVAPASVMTNWIKEIKSFSDIPTTKIHGEDYEALNDWLKHGGIAVTTYDTLTRLEIPQNLKIDMMVVDEAHYVKNPKAQRTMAVTSLLPQSEYVVYMTGTPLINSVEEMCFLVECLQPETAKKLDMVKLASSAEEFRYELSPVYLRRVCDDVAKELPEIIRKEQWCTLNLVELDKYISTLKSKNYMAIRQVSWNVGNMKLSSKAARLIEICDMAKNQGRKVIVFSFFLDTIEKVSNLFDDRQVFKFWGEIKPERRQEIVEEFTAAPEGSVLVSQLGTGGTGLNIQTASVIVFCEPTLTYASEAQAIKRAHRIGQTRDVIVYRLIADDTIDERILEILADKKEKFDLFADDSVVADQQMENEKKNEKSLITEAVNTELERLNLK